MGKSLLFEDFSDGSSEGSSDLCSVGQEPSYTDDVDFVNFREPSFEGNNVDYGEISFSEDNFIVLARPQRVVLKPEGIMDRLIVLGVVLIIENKLLEKQNRRLIGHLEEQSYWSMVQLAHVESSADNFRFIFQLKG